MLFRRANSDGLSPYPGVWFGLRCLDAEFFKELSGLVSELLEDAHAVTLQGEAMFFFRVALQLCV